jgi:hypothetical protein
MVDNKLVQRLYNTLIKNNKVNIGGLTYKSEYDESKNLINIYISNPSNLSYNPYVVIEYFNDVISFFTEFIPPQSTPGPSTFFYLKQFFKFYFDKVSINEVYLNRTDTRIMMSLVSDITNIWYGDFDSEVISEFVDVTSEGDGNRIQIKIQLTDSHYDGEPAETNKRLFDILDFLFNEKSFSDYLDNKYDAAMDFIWTNNLLSNKEYMYIDLDVMFYDPSGQRIKY